MGDGRGIGADTVFGEREVRFFGGIAYFCMAQRRKVCVMLEKTKGVVLYTTAYNDKWSVVHIYTELFGRTAYAVSLSSSRKAARLRTFFSPFAVLEMEVEHKPGRELQRIRETQPLLVFQQLPYDEAKRSLVLFLSEFLARTIREPEANPGFFDLRLFGRGHGQFPPLLFDPVLQFSGILSQRGEISAGGLFRHDERYLYLFSAWAWLFPLSGGGPLFCLVDADELPESAFVQTLPYGAMADFGASNHLLPVASSGPGDVALVGGVAFVVRLIILVSRCC